MIISHEHKFIYLKTQKTASTSTELFLFRHILPNDVVTPLQRSKETEQCGHRAYNNIRSVCFLDPYPLINKFIPMKSRKWVDYHKHIQANQVREYVGEKVWSDYFKFTFDRNIYDRQVSHYHWIVRSEAQKERYKNFDDFLNYEPDAKLDNFDIYSINGEVAVDFLGRYDRLYDDLEKIFSHLGLASKLELQQAHSHYRPKDINYQDYYTETSRAQVTSWYPGELAIFDWQF
jgi:hypothetical protein